MKKTLAERLRETRRLVILQAVGQMEDRSMLETMLASVLRDMAMETSADVLSGELAWLVRQGLVTMDETVIGQSITITARGDQAARGVIEEPGVARPALG